MSKMIFCKDWSKIDKLFLVYPSMRPYLIEEFIGLINCISNTIESPIEIILIINSIESSDDFENLIGKYQRNEKGIIINDILNITYWFIEANDIWCRDYNPISIIKDGEIKLVKALYAPSYGINTAIDNNIGIKALEHFDLNEKNFLPFKLDGGNIISNGEYVFISDKLFSENWNLTSDQITKYFEEYFGSKLIIIPTEPLDIVGHSDSIIRFLDEKTILLPSYPDDYRLENRYVSEIYSLLIKSLPIDYNYIFIPSIASDEINEEEGLISACGTFLNYLRVENNIYFPSFIGMEKEQIEIKRILRQYNKNLNIYFCKADRISKDGGIFNCISSTIFKI